MHTTFKRATRPERYLGLLLRRRDLVTKSSAFGLGSWNLARTFTRREVEDDFSLAEALIELASRRYYDIVIREDAGDRRQLHFLFLGLAVAYAPGPDHRRRFGELPWAPARHLPARLRRSVAPSSSRLTAGIHSIAARAHILFFDRDLQASSSMESSLSESRAARVLFCFAAAYLPVRSSDRAPLP